MPSVLLNTLSTLEGLLPLLPASLCLLHVVAPVQHGTAGTAAAAPEEVAPSPLIAALLRPDQQVLLACNPPIVHAVLTRIAGLIVQVGGEGRGRVEWRL